MVALPQQLAQHQVGQRLEHPPAGTGEGGGEAHPARAAVHPRQAAARDREGRHVAPRQHLLGVAAAVLVGHGERGVNAHPGGAGGDGGGDLVVVPDQLERLQASLGVERGDRRATGRIDEIQRFDQMNTGGYQ